MNPLLPVRHPEQDFFIADFGDVIPKSDMASMENPLFSLATKPDIKIRRYEHNGNTVTITPSVLGIATIHDKDILIYCISRLMQEVNKNMGAAKKRDKTEFIAPPRTIKLTAHDLLVTTNRETSGDGYKRLKTALERLAGTRIETNIKTNKQEITEGFGIIDNYRIVTENPKTMRMIELEVTLSKWLYNSVLGREVLSINRDYFRLRKPLERRIYEIARKHCGTKSKWKIKLESLHKKSGSSGSLKEFKRKISNMIINDHLPDYNISMEGKYIIFYTKTSWVEQQKTNSVKLRLKPQTFENAKKILIRSGLDVYAIEAEWMDWWKNSGEPELKSPDGAFINFCKNKVGRN